MALVKCKECKKEVSDKAKLCPHCGVDSPQPYKKMSFSTKLYGIFLLITIIFFIKLSLDPAPKINYSYSPPLPPPSKTKEERLKERRNDVYIDGVIALKKQMKDPSSFELDSVFVMPNMTMCYKYRAKNSFGALNIGFAVITDTQIILSENNKNFEKIFKKECDSKVWEQIR